MPKPIGTKISRFSHSLAIQLDSKSKNRWKLRVKVRKVNLLGPVASVRLVNPIDEEEYGREALDVVLVRQLVLHRGVHLRQNDAVGLQLGGGGGVLRRQGLAVAAPGRVEFHHHVGVVLHHGREVPLLQYHDVFVVHRGNFIVVV